MKSESARSFSFNLLWQWFCLFLATGFFTGFLPRLFKRRGGGGFMGVLLAFIMGVIFIILHTSFGEICLWTATVFFISVIVIDTAEYLTLERYGPSYRHKGTMKVEWDFNSTNIDEILAVMAASLSVHMFSADFGPKIVVLAALAFFFWGLDAKKPWKIHDVERYYADKNMRTEAIIMDDLAAAVPVFIVGVIIMQCL